MRWDVSCKKVNNHPDQTLMMLNNEMLTKLPNARRVTKTIISNILQGELITIKRNSRRFLQKEILVELKQPGISMQDGWCRTFKGMTLSSWMMLGSSYGQREPEEEHAVVNVLFKWWRVEEDQNTSHLLSVYHELHERGMPAELFSRVLQDVANYSNYLHNDVGPYALFETMLENTGNLWPPTYPHGFQVKCLLPPWYSFFLNVYANAFSIWKHALNMRFLS